MSPPTLHTISLHPIIVGLKNAHGFISKAYSQIQSQGLDPNTYLTARLHPTMFDFTHQIRLFAKAAITIPSYINPQHEGIEVQTELSGFPELLGYIEKVIGYLESVRPETLDGREKEPVLLKLKDGAIEVDFEALEFVMGYAHPNFWFHVTTAYDILRKEGLELGKADYINGAGLKTLRFVGEKP